MSNELPIDQPPIEEICAASTVRPTTLKEWAKREGMYGMPIIELSSWNHFGKLLQSEFRETDNYIWRGQRDAGWLLISSLDRLLKKLKKDGLVNDDRFSSHLNHFRDAMLGRRGPNPPELNDDEAWALGQHNGLATPLLDWTRSPYVASYFAFCEQAEAPAERCAIFALNKRLVLQTEGGNSNPGIPPIPINIFRPRSDDNQRLINQAGLFTKITKKLTGASIEDCLRKTLSPNSQPVLYKIIIPNNQRDFALRTLNRMNINHATLFPDVYGAAIFTNVQFEIKAANRP